MAKYSYEFKRKIVQAYLNGEGGYSYLAKKYNISVKRNIEAWVHTYKNLKEKDCYVQDKIIIILFNLNFM